jgi:hypothetical protein
MRTIPRRSFAPFWYRLRALRGMLPFMPPATHNSDELPVVSAADTVDEIVARSQRTGRGVPLRRTFLQQPNATDDGVVPGPLAPLVAAGDHRGLILYLLLVTKASSAPWNAHLAAAVWARALGLPLPTSKTATSTISKVWLRLERHHLVHRTRVKRMADVTLLREDGSELPYTAPGAVGDSYLQVPMALWKVGPSEHRRWYQELTLPELALLLIARSHGDQFRLPFEDGPKWYGISADTIARGVKGLASRELLSVTKTFKKAPLSPVGYTAEHRYTLQAPFGPIGRASSSSRSAVKERVS